MLAKGNHLVFLFTMGCLFASAIPEKCWTKETTRACLLEKKMTLECSEFMENARIVELYNTSRAYGVDTWFSRCYRGEYNPKKMGVTFNVDPAITENGRSFVVRHALVYIFIRRRTAGKARLYFRLISHGKRHLVFVKITNLLQGRVGPFLVPISESSLKLTGLKCVKPRRRHCGIQFDWDKPFVLVHYLPKGRTPYYW